MRTIAQVFGRPEGSDPLSRWIPYSRFVDRDVFATKTGCIGMTLEMEGVDYETWSQEQLERVSDQFLAAHRVFDGASGCIITFLNAMAPGFPAAGATTIRSWGERYTSARSSSREPACTRSRSSRPSYSKRIR